MMKISESSKVTEEEFLSKSLCRMCRHFRKTHFWHCYLSTSYVWNFQMYEKLWSKSNIDGSTENWLFPFQTYLFAPNNF